MNDQKAAARIRIAFFALLILLAFVVGCGSDSDSDSDDSDSDEASGNDDDDADDDDDDNDTPGGDGLTRDDFTRIASGGIDDRLNSYPWAMAMFDGDRDGVEEVYIGTIANALCLQIPMASFIFELIDDARPPAAWQCDLDSWDPGNWLSYYMDNLSGALVFRGVPNADGTDWQWSRVFAPRISETAGFRGAVVFEDALYMLGASRKGAVVWKSVDGQTWAPASAPGVLPEHAGINTFLRASAVFDGRLYVASSSPNCTYIYASDDPAVGNWELVNSSSFSQSGGDFREVVYESGTSTRLNSALSLTDRDSSWIPFNYGGEVYQVRITQGTGIGQSRWILNNTGNSLFVSEPWDTVPDATSSFEIYMVDAPDNGPIYQMAVFNDRLYAAPFNYTTGGQLWYSKTPEPGNWTRVISGGYGQPRTEGFMTVMPFGEYLYLGTVIYPGYFTGIDDLMGAEVLRIDANDKVDLLVGRTRNPGTADEIAPLSGYDAGFDYDANVYVWNGVTYDGWLYLATFDAGGLMVDFANEYYPQGIPDTVVSAMEVWLGPDQTRWGGFDFVRTQDGEHWETISMDGFENAKDYGIRSFAQTPWGLLTGVANPYDGFELWLGHQ
jgi:hypothetical protein